ncbi:MAG: hypothetical protein LBH86_05480 [Oscillospiraceae bacterium]|jgi:hypothetical protein|nr:hypothetical protein [Oscillospiraceae bacterium]
MACIKIALRFLLKSLILSIIMMMQLSITIILANFLLGKYNALSDVLRITDNFSGYDTYMYMPASFVFNSDSRNDNLEHLLNKYKSEIIFEQSVGGFYQANNGTEYEVYALGDTTSRTLTDSTINGKWYADAECLYVPCVTYQDHDLGDIISLVMDNHVIEFQVVGTVSRRANILKFHAASNKPVLEHMFANNGENSPYSLLLFNQADIPYEFDIIADNSALVYFNTNDDVIREKIIQEFRNIAWFVQLEDARIESEDQFAIHLKTLTPMIVSIFLVGLISMLCLTVLNSIRHMRIVSIYYIVGMSWASHFGSFIIYMLLQIVGVCLLIGTFLFFNKILNIIPMELVMLNESNINITIVITIATIAIALLAQIYMRKKETPVKYIKESW